MIGHCMVEVELMNFGVGLMAVAQSVPSGVRMAYANGEHLDRDRALHGLGEQFGQARALTAGHGAHLGQARASQAVLGDQLGQARASQAVLGDQLGQARASQAVLGDQFGQECLVINLAKIGLLQHYMMAYVDTVGLSNMVGGNYPTWGLHDTGCVGSCPLPQHGVGGGGVGDESKGGMSSEPWTVESQAGPMNTKGELADLYQPTQRHLNLVTGCI